MKKYILIILCCLTSFPLWSYNVNMIVEHYSVDQGLPKRMFFQTMAKVVKFRFIVNKKRKL